ncbi:MAG TPA: sterol desaturase family protein, partial [Thermoanaerobaculia bacterium]|nr:sterol desaturase family protein [Thermoanaerobaculia bacterium]
TRTDLLYNAFYVSGLYQVAFWAPIYAVLEAGVRRHAPFLSLNLFATLPFWLHWPLFFVCNDFVAYWYHRLMHANRYLWSLHSIHHSQRELSFLTGRRFHVLDSIFDNFSFFFPAIVLGMPVVEALPLRIAQHGLSTLQHSDLDFTFGRLGRVIVSPAFHRWHHSRAATDYDRNFGVFLSVWDQLFSTAVFRPQRPAAYGVDDPVPESFLLQIVYPIRRIASQVAGRLRFSAGVQTSESRAS